MNKTPGFAISLIVVASLMAAGMCFAASPDEGTRQGTGPVHNIDNDLYYDTIQEGIDDAGAGDTIEIAAGTYYENVIVNKTLNLLGADQAATIIDANGNGSAVTITSDFVSFSGFTVRNSGVDLYDAGVFLYAAANCTISNITSIDNYAGIYVESSFHSFDSSLQLIADMNWVETPVINNARQVAWTGREIDDAQSFHVRLWSNGTTTTMPDDCGSWPYLQINDLGHLAWSRTQDDNIYFWDGQDIELLSTVETGRCVSPTINDHDLVAWISNNQADWPIEIYYWNGTGPVRLTDNDYIDDNPYVNNNGYIVWTGMHNMTNDAAEIILWNKTDIIQITDNNYSDRNPRINDNNQIFWTSETGFYMWENGTITKLYDGNCYEVAINDNGQAVFIPDPEASLLLWNGTAIVTISDNSGNTGPKINNLGHVTWYSYDSDEVYFWDGERTIIISEGALTGDYPDINDNDQVVWRGLSDGYGKLFLWNNYGQTVKYANNNLIFNNTVAENEHGIRIETAYGNRIYHNLLINNSNQSFCVQSNYWDLDYPKGGNFWSDYNGTDEFSGAAQDIPGSDGIGDASYRIKGGNFLDRYPLMKSNYKPEIPGDATPDPPTDTPDVVIAPSVSEFQRFWFPLIIGSVITLAAGLGMSLEIFGYSILTTLMILYSKIKKEEILDQYLRGKIHGYIIANPGEHYNAIKKALGLNNGALAYHLSILEREELVKSRNEGVHKRFYPYDMNLSDSQEPITPIQKLILNQLENNPGITQKRIAAKLGIHQSTVNYHITRLHKKDLVRTERKGFSVRYFIKTSS